MSAGSSAPAPSTINLGIRANLGQFLLLILLNAFVGGMVGLERTVVPLIGSETFHLASASIITGFIVSFGVVKGLTNLISGQLAEAWGRKHTLVLGWAVGLPVPFMIMWAPSWGWVIAANALLGINQGLAWSMTVLMKIDLVGPKSRGLAIGLNEFAGYAAVGLTAFLTGWIAAGYGLRPAPFYLGAAYAALGFGLSALVVRDTGEHVRHEVRAHGHGAAEALRFWGVFRITSFGDRRLFAACQAGFVNNLKDGMVWGLFPLFFLAYGLDVERIGVLKAVYPACWGILQIITGPLSDRIGRRGLVAWGLWLQAAALAMTSLTSSFAWWLAASALLGLGTAMVYPTLIAAISDASHPTMRARVLSVYRFWRDIGYAAGAFTSGLIADVFGFETAILVIAVATFASGAAANALMRDRRPSRDA
ncbi:MAG TPA: MFS transporter [Stellaceae bacterium]|nr:MFS transporter [Stellaceae bacterium]